MNQENVIKTCKEQDLQWAQQIIEMIQKDPRKCVKHRDGRPIPDLKNLLVSSAELYGDNIAYMQKKGKDETFREITFKQTLEDVNGLGTMLMANGIKGQKVAVIGENSYEWAVSYLAVVGGVGVVVPLDKELNETELKNQIIRSEAVCVLCDTKREEIFTNIKEEGSTTLKMVIGFNKEESEDGVESWSESVKVGRRMIANGNRDFINAKVDTEKLGVLLFTSGTTGVAKGVMLSHRNVCADIMCTPTVFQLTEKDRYLSILPMHHTYEAMATFLVAIYKGASVAFCRGLKYISADMAEIKPTKIMGVPALFEKLYRTLWKNIKKQGKEKLLRRMISINNGTKRVGLDVSGRLFKQVHAALGGKLDTLISGGSAINPEVLKGFKDLGINAVQGYGLTECSPIIALNPEHKSKDAAAGVPVPGTEFKTINLDDQGIGEVCVRGEMVMLGYYHMAEETAEVLDDRGWFNTGDLGYLDYEGYLHLTGRKKNLIVTKNGKNVYPEEIEALLAKTPFIEESFVFEDAATNKDDTTIVASIKVDEDEIKKVLGTSYSDEDIKDIIWLAVNDINADAPMYRRIKKVLLRKSDFLKNTSQKIMRLDKDNKLEK